MKRHLVVSALVATTAFACSTSEPMSSPSSALDENVSYLQAGAQDDIAIQAAGETANILIFGDYDYAKTNLSAALRQGEHDVTVVPRLDDPLLSGSSGTYPPVEALMAYNTIWWVGISRQLTAEERALLVEYVNAGGGLHLGGERTSSDSMNDSLELLVNELVIGGGISVGRLGDTAPARGLFFSGYYDINPDALNDVDSTPNAVTDIQMTGVGRLGGVAARNILVTGAFSLPVGAIWDSSDLVGDAGALSIVMDSNWLTMSYSGNPLFLQNLQEALNVVPNAAPIADAGFDLVGYNCALPGDTVDVRLYGSESSDPDNAYNTLTFSWFVNGTTYNSDNLVVPLPPGDYTATLTVSDGRREAYDEVQITVLECTADCDPTGRPFWTFCTPDCPCDHGQGDCDIDADCLPGLICLHDPGPEFGYLDPEADVCSRNCPTLGEGAWNYCSPECPCSAGEGDCDEDVDCEPGLYCASDVGAPFGRDPETDVCLPPPGT